ncbi:MAG: bifunctional nicotinamidase/pyrazinamidase [Acetobacteraceae bacterium]
MKINPATDVLGVVDVQPTFMPGGELPIVNGELVVPVINRLLQLFPHAFATQDWHPADHASFASAHAGAKPYDVIRMPYGQQVLWPDHAIAGTAGAALHPDLDQAPIEVVIRKGCDRRLDSYSTFFENDHITPTGLDGWLRQRGFGRLFLTGLATDFCVAWSAADARQLGYDVFVIEDACRGIGLPTADGRTTMHESREGLLKCGVVFLQSADLAA